MTRPFALLPPGLFKVVDAHDVFSSKRVKVGQYGVDDGMGLTPEIEAELLDRADLVLAIQAGEAEELRRLAPRRPVLVIGPDFSIGQPRHICEDPVVLMVGSANPMNAKGLHDFLRFAWPLVRTAIPGAELRIVGAVGKGVDPALPGVRAMGWMEDVEAAYTGSRVVINPAVAGTGLKIKTVEALCNQRPIVLWPSGVDGLDPELHRFCRIAENWFEFARHVIELADPTHPTPDFASQTGDLAKRFAPDAVYAPLAAALSSRATRTS
jgi:hypothetical protein